MARPQIDTVEPLRLGDVDPAGTHEVERALDLGGKRLVALSLGSACHELLIPRVHLSQIGEAAVRERADEVERGRGLVVDPQEPRRIGRPRLERRRIVVDHVPEERRQLEVSDALGRLRPRLRELAGDPADLHERQPGAVDHHHGHLQEDLQLLADRDRAEVAKRLRTLARLEQKRPAAGDVAESRLQVSRLAREHERRHRPQLLERSPSLGVVRPDGLMLGRVGAPIRRSPGGVLEAHRPNEFTVPSKVPT